MFRLGLFSFILSIYQYGLLQSPWIKLVPALSLTLISKDRLTKSSFVLAGLGDFFLDNDQIWSFGLGLFLFSCCQLLLILRASRSSQLDPLWNYPLSVSTVLLGGGITFYFLSYLALPIIIYSLLLLQLLILVISNWTSLYGSGCLFFMLSDIFVLVELILNNTDQTVIPLKLLPTFGLPIYWFALLLIALSHEPLVEPI